MLDYTFNDIIYNCDEKGNYAVGAITLTSHTPLNRILNKLKRGFVLIQNNVPGENTWYSIYQYHKGLEKEQLIILKKERQKLTKFSFLLN
jgi:hypothetical protein